MKRNVMHDIQGVGSFDIGMGRQRLNPKRIGLGTVQLGMDYGISNAHGQPALEEVTDIISAAWTSGIHLLDTAPLYGNSEQILGKCIQEKHQFDIVSKTPKLHQLKDVKDKSKHLCHQVEKSLKDLQQNKLYGLLIHDVNDVLLDHTNEFLITLERLKEDTLVEKIGVSVYRPQDVDSILEKFIPDIIQLPCSVFDQRFLHTGCLYRLVEMGIEVHVRSVFLQGLLLMSLQQLPNHFQNIRQHLMNYQAKVTSSGLSFLEAALGFVSRLPEVVKILIGVTSLNELREILTISFDHEALDSLQDFFIDDERVINPTYWPSRGC